MRPNLNSKRQLHFQLHHLLVVVLFNIACRTYVQIQTRASWETITVIALPKLNNNNNNNNHFHSFSFFITKILQRFWWMLRVHWLRIFKTILIKHLLKIILIINIFFKLFCTIKNCLKLKIFLIYFKYILKIIFISIILFLVLLYFYIIIFKNKNN